MIDTSKLKVICNYCSYNPKAITTQGYYKCYTLECPFFKDPIEELLKGFTGGFKNEHT